jgi:hypothetical protein
MSESRDRYEAELRTFAAQLARSFECRRLIDLACSDGRGFEPWAVEFEITGLDPSASRLSLPYGRWLDWLPTEPPPLDRRDVQDSVVVWSNVSGAVLRDGTFARTLEVLDGAAAIILGARVSDLRGSTQAGRAGNDEPADAPQLLGTILRAAGAHPAFVGYAPPPGDGLDPEYAIAVLTRDDATASPAPRDFVVTAIMTAYNEQDIIRPTVQRLIADGISVYVLDNWSTDGTVDRIRDLVGSGVLAIEPFPPDGRADVFDLTGMLTRVAEVAASLDAQWCIHHDVDQRRDGPWPERGLRDCLYVVDRWGFNAVDHTLLEFRPVDNEFPDGTDPSAYFRYFEFVPGGSLRPHVQIWKNDQVVDLATSGGHEARFRGRRIFPFNFTLRHYPVRSQQHGEAKVFRERQPRYPAKELAQGWHTHYARLRSDHQFVRESTSLIEFVDGEFEERFLLPRLARLGMHFPSPLWRERLRQGTVRMARRLRVLPLYARVRRSVLLRRA